MSGLKKANEENYFCGIKEENSEVIYLDRINTKLIDSVSEYIIKKYERLSLFKVIRERYPYITPMQKSYIFSHIQDYNTDDETGYEARKRIVRKALGKYIDEGKTKLYPEGFVIFRLKEYENLLEVLTEKIIDDRLKEQEYEEFISLLKYFININESRPELVNILVRAEGVYELFNENGENITKKCIKDFLSEENEISEVSFDDLLISMLITYAPRKIIVHCGEKIANRELFSTISKVFDENVVYCGGCSLCRC